MSADRERTRLTVKVVPRARRSEIVGWVGDRLKLRIAAPPQDGKANEALTEYLAQAVGLPRRSVRVVAGHAAATKILEFDGLTAADLAKRLGAPSA